MHKLRKINRGNFANFQSNNLIQFLTSYTFFEPRGFVLKNTFEFAALVWYVYMHRCEHWCM